MSNLEEGLRWLDQAEADFKTARDCLKDGTIMHVPFSPSSRLKKR